MLRLCRIDAFDNALFSACLHYPGLGRPAASLPVPTLLFPSISCSRSSRLGSVNRAWLYSALSPKSQTKLQTNLPLPAQTETRLKANNNNKWAKGLAHSRKCLSRHRYIVYRDSPKLLLLRLICLRQICLSHTHNHTHKQRDSSTLNTD